MKKPLDEDINSVNSLPQESLVCSLCQYILKDISLKDHIEETHVEVTSQNTQVCPDCGASFNNAELLSSHIYGSHFVECPECENRFRNNGILDEHVTKYHLQSCTVCNYTLTKNVFMQKHMRSSHLSESV